MKTFLLKILFSGFGNFLSAFVLELVNAILVCLWSLLLIVPGIVASLSYSMSFFILNDNKTLTASEARRKSVELMKGLPTIWMDEIQVVTIWL